VGIGPSLEAGDVLKVLHNELDAPLDLKNRSLTLAAALLEMGGVAQPRKGLALARETLESGRAHSKFEAILAAQGGTKTLPKAKFTQAIFADTCGVVTYINNRFIAKLASLAGAPNAPAAGLEMAIRLGEKVEKGQLLMTLHADAKGELDYAMDFFKSHPDAIKIEEEAL
jgi:thymidine phosphorylase